jgi:hypothetical protein
MIKMMEEEYEALLQHLESRGLTYDVGAAICFQLLRSVFSSCRPELRKKIRKDSGFLRRVI